jgi:hypothetical protein
MVKEWLEYFSGLGPEIILLAIIVLIGAVREWWVWGYVFRREAAEKEFWRGKALDMMGLAEQVVTTAEKVVHKDNGDGS